MATTQSIATIKGTFAVPGVSKNKRLYTKEHIADAVTEAQALIDSGEGLRVAMLTNHGARDPLAGDVTRTAGQVTKVGITPEGHGTFEAELADTQAGRDVAALTTPDRPYLRGVSMASVWKGTPHQVRVNGESAVTADGFTLKGIDFTHNPGVVGAGIHSAELNESADDSLIFEELEEVVFVEQVDGNDVIESTGPFADNGYNGEKHFPLTSPTEIRTAWVELHRKSVTESYSPKQVQRMLGKVKSQAQKAGFDIIAETSTLGSEILEAYASVCLDNGPGSISVSGYTNEPEQLAAIGRRVALAALAGLYQLDPDNDGDIDLAPGDVPNEDDDDNEMSECPSCNSNAPVGANFCPVCGQAMPPAESAPTEKEPTMGTETQTQGAVNESTLSLTQAQLDEQIAAGVKTALEAAGVKPTEVIEESDEIKAARALIAEADAKAPKTTETAPVTAPVVTESASGTFTKEEVAALIAESNKEVAKTVTEAVLDVARKEIQEAGPRRRGLVSKSILEQSTEDVYGADTDLKTLDLQDLEKMTEKSFYPLIAS